MPITIATTRISVLAPPTGATDPWSDGYPDPDTGGSGYATKETGVRATISAGGARGSSGGQGEQQDVTFSMVCDPCDLTYLDLVADEVTGQQYLVEWVVETPGTAGLGHMQVGLRQNKGGTV